MRDRFTSTDLSPADLSPADLGKRAAAARALEFVTEGMTLGLGSGSTAAWFVRLLSERISAEGLAISGVPTSSTTRWLAQELGVPLKSLDDVQGRIDLTVDGADEFDADLELIKGGGAALLHEKIVAAASERMVVITDAGKRVERLGAFPLPVEVVRFGAATTARRIEAMLEQMDVDGREVLLRETSGKPVVTDEGHYILDLRLGRIGNAPALALGLSQIPGVVEHGLFIGLSDTVIVGHGDGSVEILERKEPVDVPELMRNEDA